MPDIAVARRYAQAMIEVAAESGVSDQVGADLDRFVDLVDAHDGLLRAALCTPVFTAEERTAVLNALLPRLELHKLSNNFLSLCNHKRRMPLIQDIAGAYRALADQRAGRVQVRVITAEPMTPAIEAEVREAMARVTGMEVLLRAEVDPTLIGGMVARVGGKVYDSSLRTRLRDIKQALLRAQTPGLA